MGKKKEIKKEITAKIVIISDEELKPIRDKINEAIVMIIELIGKKAQIMNLSADSTRTFLDEAVMMIMGETLLRWVFSMQSAKLKDLQEQIKQFLEESKNGKRAKV